LTNIYVTSFAVCGNNIFAGTLFNGVFRSTNNGTSWSAVDSGLTSTYVQTLAISGTNLFAGTLHGVFQSTNNGTTWNAINSGLPFYTDIYALAILTNGKGDTNLFAGTYYGVWQHPFSKFIATISLDLYSIGFDLPRDSLSQTKTLKITSSSSTPLIIDSVYTMTKWFTVASVHDTVAEGDTVSLLISFSRNTARNTSYFDTLYIVSNSIYSLTKVPLMLTNITSVSQNSSSIPNSYGISQNYPNPFNPTTVVNYQLPINSFVTLKVYDMLGREVAILLNERKSAGYYSVTFNAVHLPSGVYFYRLQAGPYTQTKKIVLLK
jgi:hypothetical protein